MFELDHRRSPSLGRRLIWDDSAPANSLEWAPPLRIISIITLFASTLDLMADFLLCSRLAEFLENFQTDTAKICAYGYFFFTGVSILVYIAEMVDVFHSLKYDEENVFFARLAKSMVLVCEEVPLPLLLNILFSTEPRMSLASPMHISSWIKIITLTWGIVKFTKLRFFLAAFDFESKARAKRKYSSLLSNQLLSRYNDFREHLSLAGNHHCGHESGPIGTWWSSNHCGNLRLGLMGHLQKQFSFKKQ
ncbi:hypothetical protein M3Y98_00859900 [Aphelenchoides besseyi]|nr:hypothetical protein M3Y98_00859900 [Aphelenchoides besseyi]